MIKLLNSVKKITVSILAFVMMQVCVASDVKNFKEGVEYQVVSAELLKAPAIKNFQKGLANKITVVEFFSFGCHWCHQLEPFVDKWELTKPKDVGFEQIPVVFHPSWIIFSKAFYAAKNLKVADKVNPIIFESIHVKNSMISSVDQVQKAFLQVGVKAEDFQKAYHAFGVERQLDTASGLFKALQLTEIPAVYVMGPKGTFKVMTGQTADKIIEVVDFLIQQQRN